jgi:hypothetical protein
MDRLRFKEGRVNGRVIGVLVFEEVAGRVPKNGVRHSDPSSHSFQREQPLLSLEAPSISCEVSVSPHSPVAGNCKRDGVRSAGSGHSASRRRSADRSCDFTI